MPRAAARRRARCSLEYAHDVLEYADVVHARAALGLLGGEAALRLGEGEREGEGEVRARVRARVR